MENDGINFENVFVFFYTNQHRLLRYFLHKPKQADTMFSVKERDVILFAITGSVERISSLDMDTFMAKRLTTNIFIVNISLER